MKANTVISVITNIQQNSAFSKQLLGSIRGLASEYGSIQLRQVSHHSCRRNKNHFTIWCFQSTTRDNIFNWQHNCLDVISVCMVVVGGPLSLGLVRWQASALAMRQWFLGCSLFAVYHKSPFTEKKRSVPVEWLYGYLDQIVEDAVPSYETKTDFNWHKWARMYIWKTCVCISW